MSPSVGITIGLKRGKIMIKNDAQIKKDVLEELAWTPNVNSNDIGVTVKDSAVVITGTVKTYSEKQAAENAAKRVKGVRAIAQEVEVKPPSSMIGTDEKIAEQISHLLKWSATLYDLDIKAQVRHGYVTLEGEVNWGYQKRIAERHVGDLKGVTGLTNSIVVGDPVTRVKAADIKRQINAALHRRASLEASNVDLSVSGGKVVLEGTIDSFYERELIANAAWECSGVSEVVDKLRVV